MPGVMHYLQQGDGVIRGVAVLLLIMSLLTWCLALGKAWGLNRAQRQASRILGAFWDALSPADALTTLKALDSERLFAPLAEVAFDAADMSGHGMNPLRTATRGAGQPSAALPAAHTSDRSDYPLNQSLGAQGARDERVMRAVRTALLHAQRRLEAGQTLLATIAGVSPFVGLLGTVWGIYHALIGIAASGQPSIADIAGPVGEALIMTAFGLAVAIPAVVAYNLLGRRVRTLSDELEGFAHDLHAFLSGASDGIRQV